MKFLIPLLFLVSCASTKPLPSDLQGIWKRPQPGCIQNVFEFYSSCLPDEIQVYFTGEFMTFQHINPQTKKVISESVSSRKITFTVDNKFFDQLLKAPVTFEVNGNKLQLCYGDFDKKKCDIYWR